MQIGPYKLKTPWILAPMAGVSEMPFRVIARDMGASAAPTELISAKGLLYGSRRTERYLARGPNEHPFWVQIFGSDENAMAIGAERAVELGAEMIDVNMGCPVKKVTRDGGGAALMRDPKLAARIVAAIVKRVSVPVTAKIRAGWDKDSINFIDLSRALVDAGCSAIALHARTQSQSYGEPANWSFIARLVEAVDIPVIGNGDAKNAQLAKKMLSETGCQAVMIGRGALGNPWVFRELSEPIFVAPTPKERFSVIRVHLENHAASMDDPVTALRCFRPHLGWYSHGLTGASEYRRRVMRMDDMRDVLELSAAFFEEGRLPR